MILCDANNLAWRAWHAGKNLTSKGRPVGVLHIGLTMLIGLPRFVEPQPIIFLWDQGTSWRKDVLPSYKGNRDHSGDDYKAVLKQIKILREILSFVGVKQAFVDHLEADDLAGIFTELALEKEHSVILVSGDKDWFQLLRPGVRQLRNWVSGKPDWWDPQTVWNKYAVKANDWAKYLALVGDEGDNIPKALNHRRGPVIAKAFLNGGKVELSDEERERYEHNLKVTTILRSLERSKLRDAIIRTNRTDEGWSSFEAVLKDYELVHVWGERGKIWEIGGW